MRPLILLLLLPFVVAAAPGRADGQTPPQVGQAAPQLWTDLYLVHFDRANPGQAAALGDRLKVQGRPAAVPGHYLVLRHQEGDDWDYCVIEHLGAKPASGQPAPQGGLPDTRDLSAWRDDTSTLGPPWPEFVAAMGLDATAFKTDTGIYVLSVYGAAQGHRDELEKLFLRPNAPDAKVTIGAAVLQNPTPGKWDFLYLTRFNSWADLAADRAASAQLTGASDTWAEARQHTSFHKDTIADRIR
jgi:hypothetical protein